MHFGKCIHPLFKTLVASFTLMTVASPLLAQDLFVSTTTFELTGSTAILDAQAPFTGILDPYTVHSDAVVRTDGCHVYVINRFLVDSVLVLDACNGYSVVTEFSVGNGSNPRDIEVVSPTKAYVTRYEETRLWIVNPITGTMLGDIDLAAFADADGIPEMDQMAVVGDRLFVAIQRVDRNGGFVPAGGSALVVIDINTDQVIDADPISVGTVDPLLMATQNPIWRLSYVPALRRLMSVNVGNFVDFDGGVEVINPFTLISEGLLVDESTLGGDVLDAVIVSETLGYAIISELDFDTCVKSFNPTTGLLVQNPVACAVGFQYSDLELTEGKLFVTDRTPSAPGVLVFDALTGSSLAGPISTGLPPFDMVPFAPGATAAPPASVAATLRAVPNPFNPRTRFELSTDGLADASVSIFDVRGRLVNRLEAGGSAFEWDGNDMQGSPVGSGVYRAVVDQAPWISATATLVR